jgi:ankyrin repeat protein
MPAPEPELIRDFVTAGHGNLVKLRTLLEQHPALLNAQHPWSETDFETAIQAAAQVGNKEIAEYLLEKGAPLEICTAAMLGRAADVTRLLDEQPERIHVRGAHGITLLAHAALSGDVDMLKMLFERGAREGASLALGNAVMKAHVNAARWLIENAAPDLTWNNYEDKSLLTIAGENNDSLMTALFLEHNAA